jgi:hypothetical protein
MRPEGLGKFKNRLIGNPSYVTADSNLLRVNRRAGKHGDCSGRFFFKFSSEKEQKQQSTTTGTNMNI